MRDPMIFDSCIPLPFPFIAVDVPKRALSASPHLQAIADVFLNPDSPPLSRRSTSPFIQQLAHQLAAETLLSIAPPSDKDSTKSPDKTSPTLPPISSLDVPDHENDARGTKRKIDTDSGPLKRNSPERLARTFSRSPRPAEFLPAPISSARPNIGHASSSLPSSRYSIYGPTSRDALPNPAQPWSSHSPRYPAPRGPPPGLEPDFFPRSHDARISRRELSEHREQLREGRRWLEAMLAKTHQHLAAVDDLLSQPPPAEDDWEARDRQRAREIERLELERDRERRLRYGPGDTQDHEAPREREMMGRTMSASSPKRSAPSASSWEGEAVVGAVALPRRQQQPSNGPSRPVWSFEKRP